MKTEVTCACEFLGRILLTRNVPMQFIKPFSERLKELLTEKYKDHWHPENPRKGSAYRCLRINGKMDPVLKEAAKVTGLSNFAIYLPKEFTMWIDPFEVSYRFGEDGSICQCSLTPSEEFSLPKWSPSGPSIYNSVLPNRISPYEYDNSIPVHV